MEGTVLSPHLLIRRNSAQIFSLRLCVKFRADRFIPPPISGEKYQSNFTAFSTTDKIPIFDAFAKVKLIELYSAIGIYVFHWTNIVIGNVK